MEVRGCGKWWVMAGGGGWWWWVAGKDRYDIELYYIIDTLYYIGERPGLRTCTVGEKVRVGQSTLVALMHTRETYICIYIYICFFVFSSTCVEGLLSSWPRPCLSSLLDFLFSDPAVKTISAFQSWHFRQYLKIFSKTKLDIQHLKNIFRSLDF